MTSCYPFIGRIDTVSLGDDLVRARSNNSWKFGSDWIIVGMNQIYYFQLMTSHELIIIFWFAAVVSRHR